MIYVHTQKIIAHSAQFYVQQVLALCHPTLYRHLRPADDSHNIGILCTVVLPPQYSTGHCGVPHAG
jgi:hypothetical protein